MNADATDDDDFSLSFEAKEANQKKAANATWLNLIFLSLLSFPKVSNKIDWTLLSQINIFFSVERKVVFGRFTSADKLLSNAN